jgi:Tfp pilus assembly PilM family ATPase
LAVIDIGGYSLKVFNKNKTYDFVLPRNCVGGTFTLPFIDEAKLSYVLARVKKEARAAECDLIIPDQWARQLFVAITNDEAQEKINNDYIIWRSKDQIREEVYSGAKICAHVTGSQIGADKKQHISAYLCLVKYEILNKVTDVFAQNGVIINSIELSSHALYNYISASCAPCDNFAVINIGYEVCTIYFFINSQPVYVRIIETAGKHFEEELRAAASLKASGAVSDAGGAAGENGAGGLKTAAGLENSSTPASAAFYAAEIKEKERYGAELAALKIFPSSADYDTLEAFEARKSPVRDNFLKEIHLTFEFFSSKFPAARISRVFLSGGMCKFGGLDFFMTNFLTIDTRYAAEIEKIQNLALYASKEL